MLHHDNPPVILVESVCGSRDASHQGSEYVALIGTEKDAVAYLTSVSWTGAGRRTSGSDDRRDAPRNTALLPLDPITLMRRAAPILDHHQKPIPLPPELRHSSLLRGREDSLLRLLHQERGRRPADRDGHGAAAD